MKRIILIAACLALTACRHEPEKAAPVPANPTVTSTVGVVSCRSSRGLANTGVSGGQPYVCENVSDVPGAMSAGKGVGLTTFRAAASYRLEISGVVENTGSTETSFDVNCRALNAAGTIIGSGTDYIFHIPSGRTAAVRVTVSDMAETPNNWQCTVDRS